MGQYWVNIEEILTGKKRNIGQYLFQYSQIFIQYLGVEHAVLYFFAMLTMKNSSNLLILNSHYKCPMLTPQLSSPTEIGHLPRWWGAFWGARARGRLGPLLLLTLLPDFFPLLLLFALFPPFSFLLSFLLSFLSFSCLLSFLFSFVPFLPVGSASTRSINSFT